MDPIKKHRIVVTAICANLSNFALGTCIGWPSPIIPKLRVPTADTPLDIGITTADEGWIGSIIAIGAFASSLIGGTLVVRIGRKWTMIFSSVLFIVSYILLMVASKIWIVFMARAVQGVAGGLVVTAAPMYIGEIATDDLRGPLGSIVTLLMIGGILYCYIIGPYVSYMALQWCCIAIPIISTVLLAFLPESPYYFAEKGRITDGIKSLQILRGQTAEAVKQEMAHIQATVDEDMSKRGTVMDILRSRGHTKALIICCGLLLFQQLSGTSAVTFNSQSIFSSAKSTLDPVIATIILGLVQFVSNLFTPFVIERTGRRIILLISSIGMCLALVGLGAFFYIQAFGDASAIIWLPVPALIVFNVCYAFGFGPIPYALLCEMFPSNIKPIATSIATSSLWLMGFFVTRWFPELNDLGAYYAFWLFGSLCALAFFFVVFVVFETKGLTLQQIQERLHK